MIIHRLFSLRFSDIFLFGQVPDKYSVLGYVIILAMAAWMFFYNKRPEEKE